MKTYCPLGSIIVTCSKAPNENWIIFEQIFLLQFVPFIDVFFQFGEIIRYFFHIVQYILSIAESFGLADLCAEAAKGFQLARLLLQLGFDLLWSEKKQGFCTGLRRSGFTDYPLIHPANLNSLPVVVHAAVWKPNRGQSLLSALHEGLQVNLQTLVAFQFGQQHFELSFPLCLAGLCISVTLAEVMKADLEAWRCGGVWALQKAGNRVPSCFYTALPGQQLLTKFLPEKKG